MTDRAGGDLRETLGQIEKLLDIARAIQWEKSPAPPTARDDTSERSKGGPVNDPTLDIVCDERRLAVRAEVRRAEAFLAYAARVAGKVRRGLDRSIGAWEGTGN